MFEVESIGTSHFKITVGDRQRERIARLSDIYGVKYEDVLKYMLAFADYMATTRILNEIDKG